MFGEAMAGSKVEGPGFHRWEAPNTNPLVGCNQLFGKIFAKNCLKMGEIGPGGARVPSAPLDLPMCCSKYRYR